MHSFSLPPHSSSQHSQFLSFSLSRLALAVSSDKASNSLNIVCQTHYHPAYYAQLVTHAATKSKTT